MKPNKLPLFELMIGDEATDEIFAISLVESPAIELDFQYFGKELIRFAEVNKDKRLIMGPILVPNKRIFRIDGEGKEYEVYFKPETVRRLSQMYLEKKYTDSATIDHDTKKIKGINLVESWIVDNKLQDKSKAYGFQVPEGTWMGTFRVDESPEGKKIWDEYVKTGKVKGFSIEGLFSHSLVAASKVEDILRKDIKELTEAEATIVLSKIVEVFEQPSITSTYPGEAAVGKKKKYVSPALLVDEESVCPPATQNVELNLKNRQECIDVANYGPLNPNEPNEDYWKAKADMFKGDVETAKKSICGNCAFFVQTKAVLDCIAGGINDTNEWDTIEAGDLGYCEAFDFKCAANRTCDAWVVGGPITD
jgi:hypothetical protein